MSQERIFFADHDGTLTDSSREMGEYSSLVTEYNSTTLGIPILETDMYMNRAKSEILANPGNYGWKWGKDGLIVAAATSDHYLFNQAATELFLEKVASHDFLLNQKVEAIGGREAYINALFAACAPKLGVFYREEARPFLMEVAKMKKPDDWAIVTNSDPIKIAKKLSTLNLGFDPNIIGGAKKMEVNREWTGLVPAGPYKGFKGYPKRGVELQRETFYKTLEKAVGERMKDMIFVEDVAEFVAWVDYLTENNTEWENAKTALVLTPMTPSWERARYEGVHKNRFGSSSLMQILDWASEQ